MAIETPMQTLKKLHGSKDKLISSIIGSVKKDGESDEDAIARLKSVSNNKLLRMGAVAKKISDRGGREKVVSALGEVLGRAKDSDYLSKLGSFSNGRLVDMLRSAEKRKK